MYNSVPGTKYRYSGESFEYLSHAIENRFGKPFEEMVNQTIFELYGMNDNRHLWNEDVHKLVYDEEHNMEV